MVVKEEYGQSDKSLHEGMSKSDWKKEYANGTPHWAEDLESSGFAGDFVTKVKSNSGKKVLEIGCGNGKDAISFSKSGLDTTSIDIVPNAVGLATRNARKKSAKVRFMEANAEKLPFNNNEFDGIYTLSVLHSTDMTKSIPELHRVLKPDGLAFIYIYGDVQYKDKVRPKAAINYDDFIDGLKDTGFTILSSRQKDEKDFDEYGEKHSMFITWVRKK